MHPDLYQNPIARSKAMKPDRKRTRTANIRMTPADYEHIRRAAALDDETFSRYMVQASLRAAERTFVHRGAKMRPYYPPSMTDELQDKVNRFTDEYWYLEDIARLAQQGLDAGPQIARLQREVGKLMDEVGRLRGVQQGPPAAQERGVQEEEL